MNFKNLGLVLCGIVSLMSFSFVRAMEKEEPGKSIPVFIGPQQKLENCKKEIVNKKSKKEKSDYEDSIFYPEKDGKNWNYDNNCLFIKLAASKNQPIVLLNSLETQKSADYFKMDKYKAKFFDEGVGVEEKECMSVVIDEMFWLQNEGYKPFRLKSNKDVTVFLPTEKKEKTEFIDYRINYQKDYSIIEKQMTCRKEKIDALINQCVEIEEESAKKLLGLNESIVQAQKYMETYYKKKK